MAHRNCTATWVDSASRWQVCVTNDDGKRKVFTCSTPGRAGQIECNRKADKWLLEGEKVHGRCGKYLDEWLEHVRKTTSTSNYTQRSNHVKNWIKPVVNDLKLESVKRTHWQTIIDNAYVKGLSKKSLQNIRGTISAFLAYNDMTTRIVIPSGATVSEKHILQPDALHVLMSSAETCENGSISDEWYIYYFRFLTATGLRPGEAVALEWKHVKDDRIMVRGSINKFNEFTHGKNKNAVRDEPMTTIARSILDSQKKMLKSFSLVSPYVFPDQFGAAAQQNTIWKHWKRYLRHHSLPHLSLYELRHTYTSIMAGRSGMTLQELRTVMGHSKNMDTLGVYSKNLDDQMERIRDKTDAAFDSLLIKNS